MAKYLISGGGTGGHIFPAISIANALREAQPDCDILFVGAKGRMEMERVPAAGYKIKALNVVGVERKHWLSNIKVILLFLKSIRKAKRIISNFKPDVAIGVGGYASGAALKAAAKLNIPIVLQEQNSYAGLTNKMLSRSASAICVAYDGMHRFFPADRIIKTGNPVRQNLLVDNSKREEAYKFFDLDPNRPTLLIIGGSLGARTINQSVISKLQQLKDADIQVVWQTGKAYYKSAIEEYNKLSPSNVRVLDFVARMDFAYLIADLVISRAGASSISELCLLRKPAILVPSPNVAEDHQTHNALALSDKGAAILVKDFEANDVLIDRTLDVIKDEDKLKKLACNIERLAEKDSAKRIADVIINLTNKNR